MIPEKLSVACLAALLAIPAFAQDKPKNSDIENIGTRDINRGSINFYSIDKEIAMGRQLSAEYERTVKLYESADVNEFVNRLGQNIVLNSDARRLPVTFRVVDSSDLDAKGFPGGFVYVTTETIAALDNEAELAFVLAQQVAHIAARHGTEQASRGELVNFDRIPVVFTGGERRTAGAQVPIQFLQEARAQVMEADFLGMQYLYKAGYDPDAATAFLQKIAALEPGATARMFSSVPPAADRIEAMQKNILVILPARNQNVVTTPEFERIKTLVKK
jgi:predicted Zn-dependent protease